MKKKTLIAFLVTLIYAISLIPASISVQAAPSVPIVVNDNKPMVDYLTGGITFASETVTRAEMAAGFVRLMHETVPGSENASFSDVPLDDPYAKEIYTALSMNIISKADTFNPNDAVTYAQAIRMAVSLLGYGGYAESLGGYPTGYFAYAGRLSINMKKGPDDTLSPEEAVLLLAKTAQAEMFVLSGFGEYERVENASILKTIRKIKEKHGIITANQYSSLYNTNGVVDGFALDGKIFYGLVDSNLLGYEARVFYKEEDERNKVCFVMPVNTDVVTLSTKDCGPIVNNILTDDNDKKYKIEPAYNFIYNGKAYSKGDADKYFLKDNVLLTLIDAGEDGVYETIHAMDPKYLHVSRLENGISGKALYDNKEKNASIQFKEEDDYTVFVSDENGIRKGTFDDIKQDSFLSYYESEDKKLYTIYVCKNYIKDAVSSVSSTKGTVKIGETVYTVNDAFGTLWGNIIMGKVQKFLLDEQGRIVALDNYETDYLYGWIVAAKTDSVFNNVTTLKIFNEDGKMDYAKLADRVKIDGTNVNSSTLLDSYFNSLTDDMRLIRYRKNGKEEPQIISIDYPDSPASSSYLYMDKSTDINNNLIKSRGFETLKLEGTSVGQYNSGLKFTEARYSVGGACKFFVIPDTASRRDDDDEYAIGINSVIGGQEYSFAAYDIDVYGQAGAVVAVTGDVMASANVSSSAKIGVVESIIQTLDDEENLRYGINVAENKNFKFYLLSDTLQAQVSNLNPGDIIRYDSLKTGYITSLYLDYDFPTNTINTSNTSILGYSYGNFTSGMVYSANNEFINLIDESKRNSLTNDDFRLIKYGGMVTYIYVRGDRNTVDPEISIRFEPLQEVRDFVTCGEEADRAVAFTIWSNPNQIFIYRFN